jgi:hypothetical protein
MYKRLFTIVLAIVFVTVPTLTSIAQETPAPDNSQCQHVESACQSQPMAMDLSSTIASATASHIDSPVNINVGGNIMAVTQNTALTPAQLIAAYQVARTGEQSLLLGADGNAIGGSFVIGSRMASHISELLIPTNVTAINKTSDLNLIGNLTNAGTLQTIASNPAVTTANISAANIFNQQNALLTSLLNLNLFAVNDIINSGTIMSTGNLSMTAGNSIQNIIGSNGTMPLMQAMNVLNMQAPQIINQGNIISQLANANLVTNSLVNSGAVQALASNINITTMPSLEKTNLSIRDGDFLSQELNINAENDGIANIDVDEVTGITNVSAGELHMTANASTLRLGEMNITGDPTYWNPTGDIQINGNLSFSGQNLSLLAAGSIYTTASNVSISTASVGNAGSILMVAGVSMTPNSGGTGGNTGGAGDSGTTVTIKGPSANGGSIDLTGSGNFPITSLTSASSSNGIAGSITLVAYQGSTSGTGGTVTLPSNVTITTGTNINNGFALNGMVSIIAGASSGNAITIGGINTSGNTANPQAAYNGMIVVSSATPTYWGNPNGATATTLSSGNAFTDIVINVSSNTGLSQGQTLYINPLGGNGEVVTIQQINGTAITVTPLQYAHTFNESIYVTVINATGVQVAPIGTVGAITNGMPMTLNGGLILPGTQQSGNINIAGAVQGVGAISIATNANASSGNGQVTIGGSMNLTENLTATNPIQQYQNFPWISIMGTSVTVSSGVIISSQIFSGPLANPTTTYANVPNTITIITQALNNAGTITGGAPASSPFSNAYINVYSPSGTSLTITGNGTYSVPQFSVIEFAAADKQTLNLNSSPTINTGAGSLVIFNAQGPAGTINLAANQTITISGGPVISINTPNLTLNSSSNFNATGASIYAISSGFTSNPLVVTATGGTGTITTTGGAIKMRPIDGQNLQLATSSGGNLTWSGATALLATSGGGTTLIGPNVSLNYTIVTNPAGGILGGEFQPYVGGYFSSLNGNPPEFVAFTAYPFHVILALMAPIIAEQQLQVLSSYTQQYSQSYVNGAAKQVGLRVSAGVFVDMDGTGNNIAPQRTAFDTAWALNSAATYGNIYDIVVGNEDIGGNVTGPATTLTTTIQGVQTQRNSTVNPITGSNYTSSTLPVTTRQEIGVLSGDVTNFPAMQTLVATVEGHIYGNAYPFFDESGVIPYLVSYPGLTQAQFNTLVLGNMNVQYSAAAQAIRAAVPTNTPDLRIGETGWATVLPSASADPGYGYNGSGLPQQNNTWASWYYQAMQSWSAVTSNLITGANGVKILTYFGTYDEPWKGINGGNPSVPYSLSVSGGGTLPIGSTIITTCCVTPFPTLTPQSIIITPNESNQEVQNVYNINGLILTITSPNFPAGTISTHANGDAIDAGHPEEPFFGLWSSTGTYPYIANDPSNGYVFTLTGTTLKYNLPVYTPPPPHASALNSSTASELTPVVNPVLAQFINLGNLSIPGASGNIAALQQISANQQTAINEQIGTRVATDYTQWTTYPDQPESIQNTFPLQGNVAVEQMTGSGQALFAAAAFTDEQLNALAQQGIVFGDKTNGNFFDLQKGFVLFMPNNDIKVQTREGIVHIPKGAIAWVMETGNDAAVYDLHDSLQTGKIKVVANGKELTLSPGTEVLMTRNNTANFETLNPGVSIGVRNIREKDMGAGIKAYIADFSLAGSMMNVPVIHSLLKSDNHNHKKAADKMLKNASILADLTGSAGIYKAK